MGYKASLRQQSSPQHTFLFCQEIPQPMLLVRISIGKRMLQWKIVTSKENKPFVTISWKLCLFICRIFIQQEKVCCISTLKTRSESITFSYGNINLRGWELLQLVRFTSMFFKAIVSQCTDWDKLRISQNYRRPN